MKYKFIAFDSLGIKSNCFLLETKDCKICVDSGIASETGSFPLLWHEKLLLREKYEYNIRKACSKSDIIIITHYHYDHHIPDQKLYKDKTILLKDPKNNINKSQEARAKELLTNLNADIRIADKKSFLFGSTRISFSRPLWHGVKNTNLGYVLMVTVEDKENKLLYTSDVDGPILPETTRLIIKENPDILILDGPPTYLLGYLHAYYNLARSILNTCEILEKTDTKLTILDHHLVRDYRYPDLYYEVYKKAKELKKKVCTVAELLGKQTKVLNGYEKNGPTKWKKWKKFKKQDMINVIRNAVENNLIQKKWLNKARNF